MVYGTVKQSGGFIYLESELGRGTTFRLYFPPAPQHVVAAKAAPTRPAAGLTVLVVEDEPAIRNLVVTSLAHQGYRVLHAASGEDALRMSAAETGRIDLLLTDASMPGISGIELANQLVAQRPELAVIVMSGYTAQALSVKGLGHLSLLPKPFTPRDLRAKVGEVLSAAPHKPGQ
jgi:DNA-binding response OmpR family regulator